MTTSTSPTRIHLSGMSSEKPCAMMSLEISEMKSTFIAISFCKTRCLPTAGFVLHPPKLLSSGPHQGVMRLDSISSLKFVEPAQGAHAVRRKRRRTAGFVLHPPKLLSSGPHQGVMRLDSISSLKFVEPAQGAHAVRRKRRRWTLLFYTLRNCFLRGLTKASCASIPFHL